MSDEEVKKGARHSSRDQQALQAAHDALVNVGAMCEAPKSIGDDAFVSFGDEVKATRLEDGNVKLAGYLVRFGEAEQPDLTGDYFTKNTDFGDASKSDGWFNHRLPVEFEGKRTRYTDQLPDVTLSKDDVGVFAEIVIGARNEYEKAIADLGFKGKLGWSSGTAPHLVDRKAVGKSHEITRWKLGLDASLTPTPAEYRNSVIPIKSLITSQTLTSGAESQKGKDEQTEVKTKESTMDKDEIKALFDEQKSSIAELVKNEANAAATKAVTDVLEKLPEVKANMNSNVNVQLDEADRPFKNIAEQMLAQKNLANGRTDPRLKRIQALSRAWMEGNDEAKALLGSNETIPSQGEFLLEPTVSTEFLKPIHEEGPFTKLARRMPVGPNSVSGWINGIDETNRSSGRWGGVAGYWVGEGESMTASQPKFKRINWELNQLTVLQYATDMMLKDSALMNSVINQSSMEELNFKVNDAFFRGTGAGQPKGFGRSVSNPALIPDVVRLNANQINHADVILMKKRMSPRAYSRMVWLANPDTMDQLDSLTFTSGSTGILSPYVRYDADGVMNLAGRPVIFNEFNPTLGSVGDILLWDPTDYLYWEGAGVEGASSIHVQFLTNQTVFRFIYRVDGTPASYSAITPAQGSVTTSPYVALAATT